MSLWTTDLFETILESHAYVNFGYVFETYNYSSEMSIESSSKREGLSDALINSYKIGDMTLIDSLSIQLSIS